MSERDAFLAAIAANPNDATPKLVFADWLEEHGETKWSKVVRQKSKRTTKDNLDAAFRLLRSIGYVAKRSFLCCRGCAGSAIATSVDADRMAGKTDHAGFVFYTRQDLEDIRSGNDFYLSYGTTNSVRDPVEVGRDVVTALALFGVETEWDGDPKTCILIKVASVRR